MRNYKRKTERRNIPSDVYARAAEEVIEKNRSLRKAAADFGINFMTLQRFCRKVKAAV